MPFGKYSGTCIDQLPDGYLQWLYWQDFLEPDIEQAVRNEVADRWPDKFEIKMIRHNPGSKSKPSINQAAIKSIFRELALKCHPDHGGCTAAMQALNEFMERLRAIG